MAHTASVRPVLLALLASGASALRGADAGVLTLSPGTTEALIAPGAAPATRFAASELTKDMRNEGFASMLLDVLKPLFSR